MATVREQENRDLENMFADIEHEQVSGPTGNSLLQDHSSPMVMLTFYRRLFPFKQLFLWLNQSPKPSRAFTHREFSLTLQNDAYLRYNSFATWEELRNEIVRLNPARFEIGPVYTQRPKDKKTLSKDTFKPLLRELVFDIDMTDYDNIRTCCKDKGMCDKCWKFIALAAEILNHTLTNDFGFKHLLWVYSGRRGIHCWVSDSSALPLNDASRKSLAIYIDLLKNAQTMDKPLKLSRPLHPSIENALVTAQKYFKEIILEEQDCFRTEAGWTKLLGLLPASDTPALTRQFKENPNMSSKAKWDLVKKHETSEKFQNAIEDIILHYTYPRIDAEVSKHLNHLLKSPFCIHPATGRVCVPLYISEIPSFQPSKCPTVSDVLSELEEATLSGIQNANYHNTSLKPYIEGFEKYVAALGKEAIKKKVEERNEDSMEF